jgi:hypothetical protein
MVVISANFNPQGLTPEAQKENAQPNKQTDL